MKKLIGQIIKFGMVGIICTLLDYGLMILLIEGVGMRYLISSGMSFSISVVVNYILSLKFVFDTGSDQNKRLEFLAFLVLSVVGLGINQVLMWICVEKFHVYYMISKIGATGVVMVYNFITRKLILEKKES